MVLNRLLKIVAGRIDLMCSYISRAMHVRSWCGYNIDFPLKHKSPVSESHPILFCSFCIVIKKNKKKESQILDWWTKTLNYHVSYIYIMILKLKVSHR